MPALAPEAAVVSALQQIEAHLAAIRAANSHPPRDWLTIQDAAAELQVSPDTIERLIATGKLQAAEIMTDASRGVRRRFRIRREWMDSFLLSTVRPMQPSLPVRRRRHKPSIDFIGE